MLDTALWWWQSKWHALGMPHALQQATPQGACGCLWAGTKGVFSCCGGEITECQRPSLLLQVSCKGCRGGVQQLSMQQWRQRPWEAVLPQAAPVRQGAVMVQVACSTVSAPCCMHWSPPAMLSISSPQAVDGGCNNQTWGLPGSALHSLCPGGVFDHSKPEPCMTAAGGEVDGLCIAVYEMPHL